MAGPHRAISAAAALAAIFLAGCEGVPELADATAPDRPGAETAPPPAAPLPDPGARAARELPDPAADDGTGLALLPAPAVGRPDASPPRPRLENPAEVTAPHVYLELQPDTGGGVSVVFAIDAARDGTPSDDPAIRLSPENGQCNPQELSRYRFGEAAAERPVFSEVEARSPVTASMLPDFMAVTVTQAMLAEGLAEDREDTRAQNICTRKLWERLVSAGVGPGPAPGPSAEAAPAGQ